MYGIVFDGVADVTHVSETQFRCPFCGLWTCSSMALLYLLGRNLQGLDFGL